MNIVGKTILVTGGTGSLGKALAKLLSVSGAAEIRIFSRDRSKQELMQKKYPGFKYISGDICDITTVKNTVEGCDFVIHTAAMKDIRECERNPEKAIEVNVKATMGLIKACESKGVRRVLLVSSDKAVLPASAMGMTKALMEKCAVAFISSKLSVTIVRLGNLLGSAGTVLPIFINLAKQGKELTVTNPDMSRFLMTPESAASYIVFALQNGSGSSLVLEKVQAYTIGSLAEVVIELYHPSYRDNPANAISITGSSAGEKLCEVMATIDEISKSKPLGKNFFEIQFVTGNSFSPETICEYNSHNTTKADASQLKKIIATYERKLG